MFLRSHKQLFGNKNDNGWVEKGLILLEKH